jgi:hypothetical protein
VAIDASKSKMHILNVQILFTTARFPSRSYSDTDVKRGATALHVLARVRPLESDLYQIGWRCAKMRHRLNQVGFLVEPGSSHTVHCKGYA